MKAFEWANPPSIAADEPVFALRAGDPLAPAVFDYWIALYARATGGDSQTVAELQAHADAMRAWAREHGTVLPSPASGGERVRYPLRVVHRDIAQEHGFDTAEARAAYIDELQTAAGRNEPITAFVGEIQVVGGRP